MENKTLNVFLNAGVALFCMSTAAAAVTYECKMTKTDPSNWVPEEVLIQYDPDTGAVQVADPISHHFHGGPRQGEVDTDNAKRTTFKWDVKTTNKVGQFTTMKYRATIMKNNNTVSVTGKPLGYLDNMRSSGTCVVK